MQLEHVESRIDRTLGRCHKVSDHLIHVCARHLARCLRGRCVRLRCGRDKWPATFGERSVGTVKRRCACAARSGMAQLHPDACGSGVHEVDNAPPCTSLLVVPQPGAARGDACIGRRHHHLGEDESRTPKGSGAVMHEMQFVDDTIRSGVDTYGGNHHTVRQSQLPQLERKEHRRAWCCAYRNSARVNLILQEPCVDRGHEFGIALQQVVVGDATTARHHVEHELREVLAAVLVQLFKPFQARLGCTLRALDHRAALSIECLQRGVYRRLLDHAGRQRQCVLHGELGA